MRCLMAILWWFLPQQGQGRQQLQRLPHLQPWLGRQLALRFLFIANNMHIFFSGFLTTRAPACWVLIELAAACRGQRVIYTTPLKALSNQKLFEFRRMFGTERVGLQTGDASLNAEGDVVVMTTEVMRNIMYRTAHDHSTGILPASFL